MRKQKSPFDKLDQLHRIMHYLTIEQFQAQVYKIINELESNKK